VGVPGRVVARRGVRVRDADLDHGDLPDPIGRALDLMALRVERLEAEVEALRRIHGSGQAVEYRGGFI